MKWRKGWRKEDREDQRWKEVKHIEINKETRKFWKKEKRGENESIWEKHVYGLDGEMFFLLKYLLLPTTLDTGLHSLKNFRAVIRFRKYHQHPEPHESINMKYGWRCGNVPPFFPLTYILVDGSKSNKAGRREIKTLQMGNEGVEREEIKAAERTRKRQKRFEEEGGREARWDEETMEKKNGEKKPKEAAVRM